MADTKPSAFTLDSTPDDADMLPYIDMDGGGAGTHLPRRLSFNDLMLYLESRARQHNAVTSNLSIGASDTFVLGVPVPVTRLQVKSKFKFELLVTKTAAGTGTPTINVRYGTLGTVADASRCLITWPAANTAVADEMKLTIHGTFRAVGTGTTAFFVAGMTAEHRLTTTGFGGTGLGANIFVNATGSGFDSTVAGSILSISINGGTSAAWTVLQAHAVLENLA